MYKALLKSHRRISYITGLICLLALLLTACAGNGTGTTQPTSTQSPTNTNAANNPPPTVITDNATGPQVKPGVQPCPGAVGTPSYWNTIIPIQPDVNQVSGVTCGYLEGQNRLQALVTVQTSGTGGYLDAYVYDNITGTHPARVFQVQSLNKGQARISRYSTVLTSEVDPNSSVNKGQVDASLQNDLNREFKWSASTQSFSQVTFPGMYPHTTRYQAENAQQQVNQGNDQWELDANAVAIHFGANLLKWGATQAAMVSGGGPHDLNAIINMKNAGAQNGGNAITLTMSRLEGNTAGGIWEVTGVTSNGLSLNMPGANSSVHSRFAVSGAGTAFEGVVGTVNVLDHLYNVIGHTQATGAQGMGATSFASNVSYDPTFTSGAEEGIAALFSYSQANGMINGAVMQKQILQG